MSTYPTKPPRMWDKHYPTILFVYRCLNCELDSPSQKAFLTWMEHMAHKLGRKEVLAHA